MERAFALFWQNDTSHFNLGCTIGNHKMDLSFIGFIHLLCPDSNEGKILVVKKAHLEVCTTYQCFSQRTNFLQILADILL